MRIHRILAEAAASIGSKVFDGKKVLDRELAAAFANNPKWGRRDRSFIAESVYEVVRWRRALAFVADCDETAALCAAQWRRMGYEIPGWWHHHGAETAEMAAREQELAKQARAVRESIPDWLDALGVAELGASWDDEISALNRRAPVFLRVNTLLTTRAAAREWLAAAGVAASEVQGLADALVIAQGQSLPKAMRSDGRVEIQDAGSQLIAPLLDPQPGERLIDACAGAGGKSLHLAAMMRNDGRIFAMDVDAVKLRELSYRARRAAATCIRTKAITATTTADFAGVADRLLIDAPCSGLGTLRRQPDLKWRLTPSRLDQVRAVQKELLASYPAMLKPGGLLVYATCSILPSENRAAVEFLLERGGFTLLEERLVSPAASGFDGFYAAALRKATVQA